MPFYVPVAEHIKFAVRVGMLTLAAWGLVACSSEDHHPSMVDNVEMAKKRATVAPCEDGSKRSCSTTLDQRSGIVTCYRGEQICENGKWSSCQHGETLQLVGRRGRLTETSGLLALSSPSDCVANVCDPRCQQYVEKPPEPIQATPGEVKYKWETGAVGALPPGLASKGFKEPCSTASDCQFNTFCSAPSLGTCEHSLCSPGTALDATCSSCAQAVCKAQPSCCKTNAKASTCSHDPCATGAALSASCDPCVQKICAKTPSCCDTKSGAWNAACVTEVANTCGNTCGCSDSETELSSRCYSLQTSGTTFSKAQSACQAISSGWDVVTVDDSTENAAIWDTWGKNNGLWIGLTDSDKEGTWAWSSGSSSAYRNFSASASNSNNSDCVLQDKTKAGAWSIISCSNSNAFLCEGPKHVMRAQSAASNWGPECVQLVASQCGALCDPEEPQLTTGLCLPWYPGMSRSGCDKPDLAVGTPCDGSIPVCNHGSIEAPAGVKLVHFPANSQQYPNCSPSLSHPGMKECVTKQAIMPGQCINVTDCPELTGNREIMVNPAGAGYVDECQCGDNWSLYSGGTCDAPICAGGSSAATVVKKPVDIVFIIDNSSSMTEEIVEVQNRINVDFAQIIANSKIDYRVIMFARYGDVYHAVGGSDHPICVNKPLGGNDCTLASTESLKLNPPTFYHYSADVESWNSWCLLLGSYHQPDEVGAAGRTWTAQAPNGWSQWLRQNAFKVFVEITDDDVSCTTFGYSFNDGNKVLAGEAAAAAFDKALLELDPSQFGTGEKRNYVWHSIVAMAQNKVATEPWKPSDPINTSKCTPGSDGPGTGYQALSRLTGGLRYPTCNYSNFNAIFNAIATDVIEQSSASCTFMLPADQTSYDPRKATVSYASTKGSKESVTELTKVGSEDECISNGWYFDNPLLPTTIALCPDTCSNVKNDATARVVVELGCFSPPTPSRTTQIYTGSCSADSSNVWFDLAYEARVIADGKVAYRVRVADSSDALADAKWIELGTATASSESCPLGSSCAIDVFEKLGPSQAKSEFLELEITVYPSSSGLSPALGNYQLTYSCVNNK